jgi:CRISPR-associated endonuclease/helicase Cas3
LETAPRDAEALAAWLGERIAGGGCAAVVCNTVGRAQEVYAQCRQAMPGNAEDGSPVVDLLHSRFPFGQREARERRTLRRFGKVGECARPLRAVLVATQIIEQSLDIDFDVMVSDLAPVDLLLQRAGRLHRHERGVRPTGNEAVLGVVRTETDGKGAPSFGRAQTAVYDEHVLLRSWLALRGRAELVLPDEITPLIEQVYAEPGDAPAERGLRAAWERSRERLQEHRERDLREASVRFLPTPESGARLESLTDMGRDEDQQEHPFFRALTRLAERSVTTVCLYGDRERTYLDEGRKTPVALDAGPDVATVTKLLRNSLSVSDRRIVRHLEQTPTPAAWRRSALLRHCRPLWLDDAGQCELDGFRILVSPETGLQIEERAGADI